MREGIIASMKTRSKGSNEAAVVRFFPIGRTDAGPWKGRCLAEVAAELGIQLQQPCGGQGICGKCRIKVKGKVSPPNELERKALTEEELSQQIRLSCQTVVCGDCDVWIPRSVESGTMKILSWEQIERGKGVPRTRVETVAAKKQDLENQVSDEDCLLSALGSEERMLHMTPYALKRLPAVLRRSNWRVELLVEGEEILDIREEGVSEDICGAAVDLGTTTVAAMLCDLGTRETLSTAAAANRQAVYGDDAVSRIDHCRDDPRLLAEMQREAVNTVDELLLEAASSAGLDESGIRTVVVVGNTAMGHLLCGISALHLTQAPYVPVFRKGLRLSAKELGLRNCWPEARVTVLPFIAGFVGADTVGVILACRLDAVEAPVLALDVGTNGEVILALPGGRLLACSAAAGPAFEGAQIECGMRASRGAICGVHLDGDLCLQTVDDAPPVGICGTGLMDAVASFLDAGVVDETGRFVCPYRGVQLENASKRFREEDGSVRFFLNLDSDPIWISQKDIRELQLAKGALRAGVEILLKEAGIEATDLKEILLAGAFGSHVDPKNAVRLGLLPPVPISRVRAVGNAAGQGATLALLYQEEMDRAKRVGGQAQYVEVSGRMDFQEIFADAMCFPTEGIRV